MTEEKNKKKKIELLLTDLKSGKIEKQIEAVEALRVNGNETIIEPLLEVYQSSKSTQLQNEIGDLLNTMKSAKVPAVMISCLKNKKFEGLKQMMLTSVWSSGLDYSPHVAELISIAIESEMMEVFEIETILDNLEIIPDDEVLNESLMILGNYLNDHKNESSSKIDLLIRIGVVLKRMNED